MKENQFFGEPSDINDIIESRNQKVEVKVEDFDHSQIYLWTPEKFRERLIIMKDLFAQYGEQGIIPNVSDIESPFSDAAEPMLIGEGFYKLDGLANLIDNPSTVCLMGKTFKIHGKLEVNILPVNFDGSEDLEFIPDEPNDLVD